MAAARQQKRMSREGAITLTAITFLLLIPAMEIGFLAFVNVLLVFVLAWYGWLNTPASPVLPAAAQAPAIKIDSDVSQPKPAHVRQLTAEDAIEESDRRIMEATRVAQDDETVVALHRFRTTVIALASRKFQADIANEMNALVERNFPGLVSKFVSVRRHLTGSKAAEADRIMTEAVQRLTATLRDMAERQDAIDADRLREHGAYIKAKHPLDVDDPFSVLRSR